MELARQLLDDPPPDTNHLIYVNYVLGSCYIVVALAMLWNFILQFRFKMNMLPVKLILGIAFLLSTSKEKQIGPTNQTVRAINDFIPMSMWDSLRISVSDPGYLFLQLVLDLLPEILYLLIFTVLVSMWANAFFRSRGMGIDSANKLLIIIMAIQFTAVFLGAAALLTAIMVIHSNDATPSYGKDFRLWQGVSIVVSVGTMLFGIGIVRSISKVRIISQMLSKMARKVRVTVFLAAIGALVKSGFLLFLNYQQSLNGRMVSWAVIWFFYFFGSEIVPLIVLAIIFSDTTNATARSKSRYSLDGEDHDPHQPMVDTVYTEDEYYDD